MRIPSAPGHASAAAAPGRRGPSRPGRSSNSLLVGDERRRAARAACRPPPDSRRTRLRRGCGSGSRPSRAAASTPACPRPSRRARARPAGEPAVDRLHLVDRRDRHVGHRRSSRSLCRHSFNPRHSGNSSPGLRRQRAADERLPAQETPRACTPRSRCRSRSPRPGARAPRRAAPRAKPSAVRPAAYASAAEPRTTRPTAFAKRGGRASSSGPSPNRGCSTSNQSEAGEAVAASEAEPDRELEGEQREQPPPAGGEREERDEADDGLVRARAARVDHVQVAVRVGDA